MVALVENLAFTRDMPLHGRAQNHRCRSGVSDCSKCNCEASLRRATYDECNQLESCSKDPLEFFGSLYSLYRYGEGSPLVNLDPSGLFIVKDPFHGCSPQSWKECNTVVCPCKAPAGATNPRATGCQERSIWEVTLVVTGHITLERKDLKSIENR